MIKAVLIAASLLSHQVQTYDLDKVANRARACVKLMITHIYPEWSEERIQEDINKSCLWIVKQDFEQIGWPDPQGSAELYVSLMIIQELYPERWALFQEKAEWYARQMKKMERK